MGKIRIKVGLVEVEFEGSEEYLREELPALLELLSSLESGAGEDVNEESELLEASADPSAKKLEMTTNTIAAKLDSKSGADLVLAACAHLTFVKGFDTFKRKNILGEMRLASNYFKETYSNNLSASLKTLVRNSKILETSTDTYALEARTKSELEKKLGVN